MNQANLKTEWVERIFMLLHGRFGNTFINKFKLGKLNEAGDDIGLANAKTVWASELSGMSPERIKSALEAHYDHAPSCDDFKAQCKPKAHIQDFKAIESKLDYQTNKMYSDNVVKFVAENLDKKTDYKAWAKRIVAEPARFPVESLVYAKQALGITE